MSLTFLPVPIHRNMTKVLREVFAQIPHQVLINHFIADLRRVKLVQLELDCIHVKHTLRRLLSHLQRVQDRHAALRNHDLCIALVSAKLRLF